MSLSWKSTSVMALMVSRNSNLPEFKRMACYKRTFENLGDPIVPRTDHGDMWKLAGRHWQAQASHAEGLWGVRSFHSTLSTGKPCTRDFMTLTGKGTTVQDVLQRKHQAVETG